jgi:hypothetical protein
MKMVSLDEAQEQLPDLVNQAQNEPIGLTDAHGQLVGVLAGVTEENIDDLLVHTPGFQAMIAASRASLAAESPISADDLLAEAGARVRNGEP